MMELYRQKEQLLDNIAYNIFIHRGINPCEKLIKDEIARIERIVSDLYLKEKSDIEYNEFAFNFLNDNINEIVFTSKYSGDVEIADDYTETNVNVLISGMERRGEEFPSLV
jgi:hypothetical protein